MEIIYTIIGILIFILGYHFGVKAGQGNPQIIKKPKFRKKVFISSSNDRERSAEIREKQKEEEMKNKLYE